MTEDQKKHSLLLPALEEAWGRYARGHERRALAQNLLADAFEWLLDIAPAVVLAAATALSVGGVALSVEAATGLQPRWVYYPAAVVLLGSLLLTLAPVPVAAAAGVLRLADAAKLHAAGVRARNRARQESSFPLSDAAWAVQAAYAHPLRKRPFWGGVREGASYAEMKQKVARDVAGRYGAAAEPGGRLHDLRMMSPAAAQRIIAGWCGDTEAFLEAAEKIPDSSWAHTLKIASRLPAGFRVIERRTHDSAADERWFAALLAAMSSLEPDEHQIEAALKLAPTWDGTAEDLILAAATL